MSISVSAEYDLPQHAGEGSILSNISLVFNSAARASSSTCQTLLQT